MPQTKTDQKLPRPGYRALTVEQENCIDQLVLGKSDYAVAETTGVNRSTITDWRNHHPVFQAALNRRRAALWQDAHHRLRATINQAVENIAMAVADGDVKASIELLKIIGLYGSVGAPVGPTDPDTIIAQQAQQLADAEGVGDSELDRLVAKLQSPARQRRLEALREELRAPYLSGDEEG